MSLFQTSEIIFNHPLTRNRRLAAYRRWQLGNRINLEASIVEFVGGSRLPAQPSMTCATGNIYCGLHECRGMGFVLHLLRSAKRHPAIGMQL